VDRPRRRLGHVHGPAAYVVHRVGAHAGAVCPTSATRTRGHDDSGERRQEAQPGGLCDLEGYATEAARAVVEHALGPLGLPEVLAEVDAGNAASVAVVERLGMTPFEVVPGLLGPMTRYRRTR
jgi:hypothetical protein